MEYLEPLNIIFKKPLTTDKQVEYLHDHKNVRFNTISEEDAEEMLRRYNYIN